jgi:hypothetical protein
VAEGELEEVFAVGANRFVELKTPELSAGEEVGQLVDGAVAGVSAERVLVERPQPQLVVELRLSLNGVGGPGAVDENDARRFLLGESDAVAWDEPLEPLEHTLHQRFLGFRRVRLVDEVEHRPQISLPKRGHDPNI